ncbi:unnamed protein product [Effrenium voratum]|nr:unnamed protein product [Effrenium voratum]
MHGPLAVPSAKRQAWWTSGIPNALVAKRDLILECQEMHGPLAVPSARLQTWWTSRIAGVRVANRSLFMECLEMQVPLAVPSCKTASMVDVRNPKCTCGKARPNFGMPGDARPSCSSMVNIFTRKCKCGRTQPCFGRLGDERPSFCAQCKTPDMVNILKPMCSVCGKTAGFPDAAGKPRQLCAVHSAEVGAHVLSSPRCSRVSSDCLDALEEEIGRKFPFRYRLDKTARTWSGKEFVGLIPGRALQPDAYHPERREIVEFLGNYYHGFPPEHPQHRSFVCVGGRPAMELYQETMARLDLFTAAGLRVSYVWEHEFIEWQKAVAVRTAPPISSILRSHNCISPR